MIVERFEPTSYRREGSRHERELTPVGKAAAPFDFHQAKSAQPRQVRLTGREP
jgi:hypothetical protein